MTGMFTSAKSFFAGMAVVVVMMVGLVIPLGFSDNTETVSCNSGSGYDLCEYNGFVGRIRHRLISFIAGDELVLLNAQISPSVECEESKIIMDVHYGVLDNTAFINHAGPICMLVQQRARGLDAADTAPPRIEFFKQATPLR